MYGTDISYQNPTKKREIINTELLHDMLDNADATKVDTNVSRSVRRRPQVSVIKPHRCEATITPIKLTELMNPCSASEMLRSQRAAGSTYDMHWFSNTTAIPAELATANIIY